MCSCGRCARIGLEETYLTAIAGVTCPRFPRNDGQHRFRLVFRRFTGVFPRPEHPLALFLDDQHWLDATMLDLLEDLLESAGYAALDFDRRLPRQRSRFRRSVDAQARSNPPSWSDIHEKTWPIRFPHRVLLLRLLATFLLVNKSCEERL